MLKDTHFAALNVGNVAAAAHRSRRCKRRKRSGERERVLKESEPRSGSKPEPECDVNAANNNLLKLSNRNTV